MMALIFQMEFVICLKKSNRVKSSVTRSTRMESEPFRRGNVGETIRSVVTSSF